MGDWFTGLAAWEVAIFGVVWFALLYFGSALLTLWLTRRLLPAMGVGRVLDTRPLAAGQTAREIREACGSILVFGIGLIVPWGLLRLGWAHFEPDPSMWRMALEIGVLFLWNELHFYASHRLLHTRLLRRFHVDHHRSHVPTPFSTYAFHPVEALMLGSVPLIPMLLHDFSFQALAVLPVMSIALNSLGHANYEFSLHAPARGPLGASRRHQQHHARYHGNYGFLLPWFDRWLRTELPAEAVPAARSPRGGRG